MKSATFRPKSEPSAAPAIGVLAPDEQSLVDLQAAQRQRHGETDLRLADMSAFLLGDAACRELAADLCEFTAAGNAPQAIVDSQNVQLLAPVLVPASIRDCMCFQEHLLGAMRTVVRWRFPPLAALDSMASRVFGRGIVKVPRVWHEQPLYYKGNPHTVVGHEAEVRWPSFTEKLDFELEFGIFIGRGGKDIPASRAADHIGGYTIFNDFSARDVQLREMAGRLGPAKGKDFDTGNVLGPWLVTPDEVPEPQSLAATVRVNGDTWCRSSTASMHFSFGEIVEYISRDEPLMVGDFIGAGTLPGGCGLELDRWISPSDVVELEVERLGVLRNRVVREAPGGPHDCPPTAAGRIR